jgi:hypothetical protein
MKARLLPFCFGVALLIATVVGAEADQLKLPFNDAVEKYGNVANRTVLLHPTTFHVNEVIPPPVATNAAAWETVFQRHGLVCVPDGTKFVLLVRNDAINSVQPRALEVAAQDQRAGTTNILFPPRHVAYRHARLDLLAIEYARMLKRKLMPATDPQVTRALASPIWFHNQTPLTKSETKYVYETFLEWAGVKLEFEGEANARLVPLKPH